VKKQPEIAIVCTIMITPRYNQEHTNPMTSRHIGTVRGCPRMVSVPIQSHLHEYVSRNLGLRPIVAISKTPFVSNGKAVMQDDLVINGLWTREQTARYLGLKPQTLAV
jgi:hypothetical protein